MSARATAVACWTIAAIAFITAAFGQSWLVADELLNAGLHALHMSTRVSSPPGLIAHEGDLAMAGTATYIACLLSGAACTAACWAIIRGRRRWIWLALVCALASIAPVVWFLPKIAQTFGISLSLGRSFYVYAAGLVAALVGAALSLILRASGSSAAG